ncbi:MAG: PD40 domain-containing protein [Pirellulales bacterium]|nr:PD40 domain-containing protein [Pirellulales bacterium]
MPCTAFRGPLCTLIIALAGAVSVLAEDAPAPAQPAAEAPPKVSYYREVRPILVENCQGCHQPARPEGGLVLTGVAGMLKGGDSEEPAINVETPDESLLLVQIIPTDGMALMPKGKPPLRADQIELVRRWIAEGGVDDTPDSVRDTIDAAHPPQYQKAPVVTSLDYSPDGSLLAVSGHHEVLLHKADGSELVARLVGLSERIESVKFSPDGKRLAVTGGSPARFGEVQIWDVESRKLLLAVNYTFDTLAGCSWSPDGKLLAFACTDNAIRAIDSTTGAQVLYQGAHTDWALDTAFSTDASHVVSVSRDGAMKLTEVVTERFVDNITSITPGALKGGLISVDRRPGQDELLTGGSDGQPKLYKMYRTEKRVIGDDFNLLRNYESMPGRIYAVAFNADGSRFAVGSSSDGTGEVRVHQTDDGAVVSRFAGIRGPVYAVAFRPDGAAVASAGFDGLVRFNDPATGSLVSEFVPVPISTEPVASVSAP